MLREIAAWKRQDLRRLAPLSSGLKPFGMLRASIAMALLIPRQIEVPARTMQLVSIYQTYLNRQSTYWLMASSSQGTVDPSRPVAAARTLLKIITRDSTLRIMEPYYSGMVRKVLKEEQQEYKSRPNKAIGLIWSLFGKENAFQTLTRFYMSAVERMGSGYYSGMNAANTLYLASGVILQSRVYQRYAQQVWRSALLREHAFQRYSLREAASSAAEYLHRLPLSRKEALEKDAALQVTNAQREAVPQFATVPSGMRMTEEEMRYIVRNVSSELERRIHFDGLRRGRR